MAGGAEPAPLARATVVAIFGGWAAGLVEVSVVPGAFVLLIPEVIGWALLAVAAVALGVYALGSPAAALSGAVTASAGLATLAVMLRRVLVGSTR